MEAVRVIAENGYSQTSCNGSLRGIAVSMSQNFRNETTGNCLAMRDTTLPILS
jgi:hypothetical protein